MGRAKTPAWQPTAFQTRLDEATGTVDRAYALSRRGERLVMIKRQGRTKGGAELAVRKAIQKAEKEWGAGDKNIVMTVAVLAAECLKCASQPQSKSIVKPSQGAYRLKGRQSWNQYRQKLRDHALPALGEVTVSELNTPMCQKVIHGLYDLEAGKGFRTAALTREVLMQVLDFGIQQGYRADNPVRSVSRIPNKRPKPKSMAPNTVRNVHSAVAQHHAGAPPDQQPPAGCFPGQPEMHVVPETVYQALYGRGSLDLAVDPAVSLRSGRTGRRPRRRKEHRTRRFPDTVTIRDRPAEVTGRLVPGHWEGDSIIGKGGRSAIATLVERTRPFIILVHLAGNRGAENLRDRLAEAMRPLPAHLRRSLTWEQGTEMACHQDFTLQAMIPVYFCDRASPWQRGSHENTNGLIRQYFPKGTELGTHTREHPAVVAAELNQRPREILGWQSPLRTPALTARTAAAEKMAGVFTSTSGIRAAGCRTENHA